MLATGPAEMAEIVGKAVAGGFKGEFVGSVPTFNPAVLKSEAGPAIKAKYRFVAPWGPFGSDTPAHKAMEEAVGGKLPTNDGYTFGWIWYYPIKAVLEQAAKDGDLTRAGVREAVSQDHGGLRGRAARPQVLGDPDGTVVREALIAKPDESAPLGASVEKDFFTGPTAKEYKFDGGLLPGGLREQTSVRRASRRYATMPAVAVRELHPAENRALRELYAYARALAATGAPSRRGSGPRPPPAGAAEGGRGGRES